MALIHDDDLDYMCMNSAVCSYSISVNCATLFILIVTRKSPTRYSYQTPQEFEAQDIPGLLWWVSTVLQLHEPTVMVFTNTLRLFYYYWECLRDWGTSCKSSHIIQVCIWDTSKWTWSKKIPQDEDMNSQELYSFTPAFKETLVCIKVNLEYCHGCIHTMEVNAE
jgi:hypothetical protein